jgi:hypothetical protein
MAGERGHYRYTDDFGKIYVVALDKCKTRATINGVTLISFTGKSCGEHCPNSMRYRYLVANSVNGNWHNIKFIIGNEAAIIEVKSPNLNLWSAMDTLGFPNQPQIAWNVIAYYPEWRNYREREGVWGDG